MVTALLVLVDLLEEREEVGLGRTVGGMVETDWIGGRGPTADEGGGAGACAAPSPTRPKAAKIVENFILDVWTCLSCE